MGEVKSGFLVLTALTALLTVTGCRPATPGGGVGLGEEFSLSVSQTAAIAGEDLEITFLKVTEDSRCPTGATCIGAGRATSLVSLVTNNTTENLDLTEPGLTDQTNRQTYRGYWIDFHLLPYPQVGQEITADRYRLNLTISKVPGTGTLEGSVTIGPLTPVQTPGPTPPPTPCSVYQARKVMVYDESGKDLVKQVDIDCIGHYRVDLKPGTYTIDINHAGIDRSSQVPTTIEIKAGQTVNLDIDIDTGIR